MRIRNILIGGLLCILALLFANTFTEAAQSGWTTSIKITCDSAVPQGSVTDVLLCEDAASCDACRAQRNQLPLPNTSCGPTVVLAGNYTCGTDFGFRTDGGRIDSSFEPTFFNYLSFTNSGDCGNTGNTGFGTTLTCNGDRSPKFTVGRPH